MENKYLKKIVLLSITLLLNSFVISAQKINNYKGNISIDFDKHKVQADFKITFDSLSKVNKLKLFIHQSANILKISSNSNLISYKELKEKSIGEDKAIVINPDEIENRELTITYINDLDSIQDKSFQFNKQWLELNLYTTWFPLNMDYGLFKYQMNIQLPTNYKLIGSGYISNNGNFWEINQNTQSFDIPLIISPEFNCISVAKEMIKIYHLDLNKENIRNLEESANVHYNFLNEILGESKTNSLTLAVNSFNRPISYTRKGFISLTVEKLFTIQNEKTLAHEISHLWWNKATVSNWEDWLNESFAEYSSILILRNKYGESNFIKNIKRLENIIKDLHPLYKLKRENTINQNVITYKGAHLLYELENRIGRKVFADFLKSVHNKKIKKTSELLKLIKNELGIEIKDFVETKLNE
jgi:Peptidase family M1 domain